MGFTDKVRSYFSRRAGTSEQWQADRTTRGGQMVAGVLKAGGDPPPRGTADYLESYNAMPWFRAALSRVSYDVASATWLLMAAKSNGRAVRNMLLQRGAKAVRAQELTRLKAAGELVVLEDHPALALLQDANPLQTGLMARRATQIHLDAVGEAFWLLDRNPLGVPVAVWPVPPSWINGTPTPQHPYYRVSFTGWQGEVPATEFVWFNDVNPANPYGRGSGTGRSLADEMETDEYVAKHLKSMFYNRARPDLIVYPKGETGMQEGDVRRLEEEWTRRNRGFWNAFRPFFLRREVGVQEVAQQFDSKAYGELRAYERDTILQVFGVSPEVLGIIKSGSSRASVTIADRIYTRRVQVPRLELMRAVLQERLLPMFDERLVCDYVVPEVADEELQIEAGRAAPWALTVDEWRKKMGEEPLPDERGQVHMAPAGTAPTTFAPSLSPPVQRERERITVRTTRTAFVPDVAKRLWQAGAGTHQGLLVSLWLEPAQSVALAVPGGEAADQLHVTLAYCGKADDIGDVGIARALAAVADVAAEHPVLTGKVNGAGRFSASPQSDGKDVVYAVPDVPGLAELRHCVAECLRECGVPPRADHGWTPHITLAYVDAGTAQLPAVRPVALRFRVVTVSVGDARTEVELGTAPPREHDGEDDEDKSFYTDWKRMADRALAGDADGD